MKKNKILVALGIAASMLCSCSSTKLEKVESGVFVIDEITYVAKEGKSLTDDSISKYKEYIDSHGHNIIILNSDKSAKIYSFYYGANHNSRVNGDISWSVVDGDGDYEGCHFLYCNIQGDDQKVLTQNTDGEIYYNFYYISRATQNIDYAHITYKLVDSYKNLEAK